MITSLCKDCKLTNDETEFRFQNRRLKNGKVGQYKDSYCRSCRRVRRKKNYLENKERDRNNSGLWIKNNQERYRLLQKRVRVKARFDCLRAYGGENPECTCCGEATIEFLCIDHINNDGADRKRAGEPKGGVGFFVFLRKNNYPTGFQLLCYNCNNAKKNYETCPHKRI